jgi:acid phosphatase
MRHERLLSRASLAMICAVVGIAIGSNAAAQGAPRDSGAALWPGQTATPIRHLIVIVGENRTFDTLFGTYVPRPGQSVSNLLSKKIVNADGSPGPNFAQAAQSEASDTDRYSISPARTRLYPAIDRPNTTGAFGQPPRVPDARFPATMPNGPYQISRYVPYEGGFTGDPVHRFFQMWQQYDEGRADLLQWVAETTGAGPQNFHVPAPGQTFQGGVAMGFYNMSAGDAPLFKFIADHYAISDNYHQGVMGGTGANFMYLGTGDAAFFSDGNGHPKKPFAPQIENPDPRPGANNFYQQDGYLGGSYVNCSDLKQAGVGAIRNYLRSLPYQPFHDGNCAPDTWYLVNNYDPGIKPDGTLDPPRSARDFRLPPQTLPTIADSLSAHGIAWKYYIGGWNGGKPDDTWCSICNAMEFSKPVMTTGLRSNFRDMPDFFADAARGKLPAVAFVRPYEFYSGHPADSTVSADEDFVVSVVNTVITNRKLFASTAIFITMDEGGGYYDSGYIQPIDFFGDGPRIPLMVVSPYAKPGFVDHTYSDHGSVLKFIEANWRLAPLSPRSRDNLPNPTPSAANPYIPANAPALGDLMNEFDFNHARQDTPLIIRR